MRVCSCAVAVTGAGGGRRRRRVKVSDVGLGEQVQVHSQHVHSASRAVLRSVMPCPCATHLPNPTAANPTDLISPHLTSPRTVHNTPHHSPPYSALQCDSPVVAVVWVSSALLRLGGDDGVELLPLLVRSPVMRELLGFVDGGFLETLAARVHGERSYGNGPVTSARVMRDLAWFAARLVDGRRRLVAGTSRRSCCLRLCLLPFAFRSADR